MTPLSPTERKILEHLAQGKAQKQIAADLRISVKTVETHARHIITKTVATCLWHALYLRRHSIAPAPRR